MAKELPYLKFEPSEWLEGQIQICSDEAIVCFTNLLSAYWIKLGCISYAFALHKYCRKKDSVMQELIDNNIIEINDENNVVIKFLDEQFSERKEVSNIRKKAAQDRWNAKKNNDDAKAMQMHSKSNANREEKRREEDIVLLEKEPKQSSNNNITLKDKKSENFQKIEVVENSPYGDGELHFKCRKYEKENPGKYSVELYKEFLTHWTAKTQKGRSNGSELWRTRETFVLSIRLATWAKNNEKSNNSIKSNGRESKEDYLKRVGGELDDIFKRKEQTGNYFGIVIPREPEPANDDSRYTAFVDVGNGK